MIDRGCSTGDCEGVPLRMIRIEGKGPYPYCDECSEILTRMGDEDCGPFDPVTPEMVERAARALAAEFDYENVFDHPHDTNYQPEYWRQIARSALAAALRTTGGTE